VAPVALVVAPVEEQELVVEVVLLLAMLEDWELCWERVVAIGEKMEELGKVRAFLAIGTYDWLAAVRFAVATVAGDTCNSEGASGTGVAIELVTVDTFVGMATVDTCYQAYQAYQAYQTCFDSSGSQDNCWSESIQHGLETLLSWQFVEGKWAWQVVVWVVVYV